MKETALKAAIIFAGFSGMMACNSTNRLTNKSKEKMFTVEQIKVQLSKVRTGADFPMLAANLKNLGIRYYETKIEDGSSVFQGVNDYKVVAGPGYALMAVADEVNAEQLKKDIANHQQGWSGYLEISRQCAANGINKWAVSLVSMTCTYIDKKGNKVWVEHIPDAPVQKPPFTVEQLKAAHSKVKSGADFPAYIKEIKALGVTHYETYVIDGHIDYHDDLNHTAKVPAKYEPLTIADQVKAEHFKTQLAAHQQGKTDFLTFIKMCADTGIDRWTISIDNMTCTYYDKAGNEILVEQIPD